MNDSKGKIDKEKELPKCFVIMPISDVDGYDKGHFGRVYEYLLKKACEEAGFEPIRADEVSKTNYIIIDILHKIMDCDMVLCDLSSRNPNVLFELGIRQAFNKPAALVCDNITDKIFDIQGLRYPKYNESLRVDTTRKDIEMIAKLIEATSQPDSKDVNSLVQLLGIRPASIPTQELSGESSILYNRLGDIAERLTNLERGV